MTINDIKTIAVIGAGTMGGGIAALCLQNGFSVRLFDPSESALKESRSPLCKTYI